MDEDADATADAHASTTTQGVVNATTSGGDEEKNRKNTAEGVSIDGTKMDEDADATADAHASTTTRVAGTRKRMDLVLMNRIGTASSSNNNNNNNNNGAKQNKTIVRRALLEGR